jgi:hypothetical protein
LTVTFHRALQKLKRSLAITPFRHKNLQYLALVIDGTPEVVRLAIDLHENLVQVPAPVRIQMTLNPALPDLCGEHRPEPVPPEPYRLVADIDAVFEKKILDLTQRQRISDIHHPRKADNLGRTVEIAEGISHPRRLRTTLFRIKPVCFDSAALGSVQVGEVVEAVANFSN